MDDALLMRRLERIRDLARNIDDFRHGDATLAQPLGEAFALDKLKDQTLNAVRFLQESSLQRSNDAELFYFLGMAQNKLKKKAESKLALERCLALASNAPFTQEARTLLAELKK